jgi:glycogen debranching enzyme
MTGSGIHGFYHGDSRVLSELSLTVGGDELEAISCTVDGASAARFVSLARGVDDRTADPRVQVDRVRRVEEGRLTEEITLINGLADDISTVVTVTAVADFTPMERVKAGMSAPDGSPKTAVERFDAGGAVLSGDAEQPVAIIRYTSGALTATLEATDARIVADELSATAEWAVTVPAHQSVSVTWTLDAADGASVVSAAPHTDAARSEWADVEVRTDDPRLENWVKAALVDVDALRMTTSRASGEPFLAAGAPWFFTLFGRDSLWSARFMLPLGTELAASTLRVLARLQGTRVDPDSAEEPGKIMHELRSGTLTIPGEGVSLPPLYYGTVDATALWIVLLHEAWQWGMPESDVEALVPNLEAALAWMRDYGDSDGDGFLDYSDTSGHGLTNQGWKDSGDSIQWRDGTLAQGPIALCEVQAYAYQAAIGGAELLDRFGREGGDEWRAWAATLKKRFAEEFWVSSPDGDYPAVALDVHKQRVDTVTSNIGHLLGTGLLTEDESRLVARRLASDELVSGYGLRTMATDSAGYWPLSYHGGSVWAHDTAIAIAGLGRAGFGEEAASLIDGLLAAAAGFDYRMPELHAGYSSSSTSAPIPYPAACRPQAWSAAAAVAVLATALGLQPRNGSIAVTPIPRMGGIIVEGIRHGAQSFIVTTDAAGHVDLDTRTPNR